MNTPTAVSMRVEGVVSEYLARKNTEPQFSMQLAYRHVFIDALRQMPRPDIPYDPLHISLTVRALEFASCAAWLKDGESEFVVFLGGGATEVRHWLDQCRRFFVDIIRQWEGLGRTIQRAEKHRASLKNHIEWLEDVLENIEDSLDYSEEFPCVNLRTRWFEQIEGMCLEVAGFWMSGEAYAEFQKYLERDCAELRGLHAWSTQRVRGDERGT